MNIHSDQSQSLGTEEGNRGARGLKDIPWVPNTREVRSLKPPRQKPVWPPWDVAILTRRPVTNSSSVCWSASV